MTTQPESAPSSAGRVDDGPAGKASVLIVDDRDENLFAFETVLAPLGTEIVLARSGAEALEKAYRKSFAVVVMDVRMPALSGFQTAAILRKRELYRVTPIIFTSAYSVSVADLGASYVAGATDFIETPADGELLKFKVDAYVQLHFRNERVRRRAQELAASIGDFKELLERESHHLPLLARMTRVEQSWMKLRGDLAGRFP